MRVKHKEIDIRISKRVLWVDRQAYPLPQITRVESRELTPRRGRLAREYARRAAATVALGMVALVFLGSIGAAAPPGASAVCVALVLAILAVRTVRLVRVLTRRLYLLSIATAGSPHAALVSDDEGLIQNLANRIVDAIDNPSAEFTMKVDHIDIIRGDKVDGDKYGGDRVEGDKILNGTS